MDMPNAFNLRHFQSPGQCGITLIILVLLQRALLPVIRFESVRSRYCINTLTSCM